MIRSKAGPAGLPRGPVLDPDQVQRLRRERQCTVEELMIDLLPEAKKLAFARLSKFRVGAVALSGSGTIYLGANAEQDPGTVSLTVHAEQSAAVNAGLHGETELRALAVTAPPCGYCRQFLFELPTAGRLRILLAGEAPVVLTNLLPHAFGPKDLGQKDGWKISKRLPARLVARSSQPGVPEALDALRVAYAPYTRSPAGMALVLADGSVFAGSYVENAAFNPSLSSLQTALVNLQLHRRRTDDIASAVLVQLENSKIDHASAARGALSRIAPGVALRVATARRT